MTILNDKVSKETKPDDGGPAFPMLVADFGAAMNGVGVTVTDPAWPGLTLRDYFAAKFEAHVRYRYADAVLAERAKRGGR